VWDVGANVGIYAVLLGRAATAGHVVSFEPVPSTRERLVGNLERNGMTNVTVEPWALSDTEGTVTMAIFPNAPGCDAIIATGVTDDPHEELVVDTTTGEAYLEDSPYGSPDVIKVDIEGHEPEFLRGAWSILERHRPTLMIEYVPERTEGDRAPIWNRILADLFAVYGEADLFGASGERRVTSMDGQSLPPGLYTLIFQRPAIASLGVRDAGGSS
jgi:FkbM family methyltransferase